MPIQQVIELLKQLQQLHQNLLVNSIDKTNALKKGDVTNLQQFVKQERKYIQAINQIEQQRIRYTTDWANANQLDSETMTVTGILNALKNEDIKTELEHITTSLAESLLQLKQQEALNKELTQQSLQFIQLSMDMIAPTIENFNYGKSKQTNKRSIFDSKA